MDGESPAKHWAEATTRPSVLPAAEATKLFTEREPFARVTSTARGIDAIVSSAHELFGAVESEAALSIVRRCDVRSGRATALATVATLAVADEHVCAELRSTLPAADAPHFVVARDLAKAMRRSEPSAFLEAQVAVREAQRAFADGAFAALDGAPCYAGGTFSRGHTAVTRWLHAAGDTERERVLRDARADRDGGYWSRLREATVDIERYDVSAAYRAGVQYAEHVLAARRNRR